VKSSPPPLDGAGWIPLDAAFLAGYAHTGSVDFTIADLQSALEAGSVQAKIRQRGDDGIVRQARCIPDFWKAFGLKAKWRQAADDAAPVAIGLRLARRGKLIIRALTVVYVWQPDIHKLWPMGQAASPKRQREDQQEQRHQANKQQATKLAGKQRRGAKPLYDRERIEAEIRTRQKPTAVEMVAWCMENGLRAPTERQMARYIENVSSKKTKQT
jgi:hypothetical protein